MKVGEIGIGRTWACLKVNVNKLGEAKVRSLQSNTTLIDSRITQSHLDHHSHKK
jgi:hypothetical protein